jgi:uncharacterized membrane protein
MAKAAELKDEKIIAALLECGNVTAASKKCGVSTSVIYRRLKKPDFAKQYATASRDLLKAHTAALQCATGEAIQTLRDIMTDKQNAPSVRASAAAELLRNSLKFTETVDLINEIEALESEDMDT